MSSHGEWIHHHGNSILSEMLPRAKIALMEVQNFPSRNLLPRRQIISRLFCSLFNKALRRSERAWTPGFVFTSVALVVTFADYFGFSLTHERINAY